MTAVRVGNGLLRGKGAREHRTIREMTAVRVGNGGAVLVPDAPISLPARATTVSPVCGRIHDWDGENPRLGWRNPWLGMAESMVRDGGIHG
jgi:hypothetical protein